MGTKSQEHSSNDVPDTGGSINACLVTRAHHPTFKRALIKRDSKWVSTVTNWLMGHGRQNLKAWPSLGHDEITSEERGVEE